ncbi:cytochrome P450 [Coniophora puteana RWD-64-598 SS2]|uniref:Cytochrome P450 n=1 Tax=Coniophora puteana (strain RWD-64-598) TaxID=741705 RepID=A0A5M3MHF6_CONPW|nr:cytochrome P450 [Coniophora puteana RWD-64-598 SS2]EIW78642.1 cytochrome P450 [Coniophora puteana RWD-64-598 SS2]
MSFSTLLSTSKISTLLTSTASRPIDIALLSLLTLVLLKYFTSTRSRICTTPLRGPPSSSVLYGVARAIEDAPDPAVLYEEWERTYGGVYKAPFTLGMHRLVLCDPRALAHMWARDTTGYGFQPGVSLLLENIMGKGLFWAHGDTHKRQRKALSPAFSHSALRKLTHIFYDSTYNVTRSWNAILDKSGADGSIIEVQRWMGTIALDSIGLGGFSHDFRATVGDPTVHTSESEVAKIFHALGEHPSKLYRLLMLLSYAIPWVMHLPVAQNRNSWRFNSAMGEVARGLFDKVKGGDGVEEKSAIGLLIKASEAEKAGSRLTEQEVIDEMRTLLFAGYETSSISLTWALIEVSKDQNTQRLLREELSHFYEGGADPSYDELTNPTTLPTLDAVVHEVLRLHPPLPEVTRVALQDDVLPLSAPLTTASGHIVDTITIAKGTLVTTSMQYLNRSEKFWGPDAKEFKPSRWLATRQDSPEGGDGGKWEPEYAAKELHGHRHLWSFNDGPRMCLGKNFALAEFKASLSVLIRNFAFELRDPKNDAAINSADNLVRPKIAGEARIDVPLRVRRVQGRE